MGSAIGIEKEGWYRMPMILGCGEMLELRSARSDLIIGLNCGIEIGVDIIVIADHTFLKI